MKKVKYNNLQSRSKAKGSPENVAEYMARVPEPARTTLTKVRAAIRAAAPPQATETISYGIPAFEYHGVLVWFAAFSNHCSFFPTSSVLARFKDELKTYSTSKGTIRFPINKPLPAALIKKLVKARVRQKESKRSPD